MQESCALKHKGLSQQQSFLASPIPGSPLQSITVISYIGCIALPLPVQHAIKTTTANRLAIIEAKPPSLVHLWRGSLQNTDFTNHWCRQFNYKAASNFNCAHACTCMRVCLCVCTHFCIQIECARGSQTLASGVFVYSASFSPFYFFETGLSLISELPSLPGQHILGICLSLHPSGCQGCRCADMLLHWALMWVFVHVQ